MSDRLAAAAEVLGQKGLGDGIKREPVARPHETVSLIGKGDVGNGHAAVLEGPIRSPSAPAVRMKAAKAMVTSS